MRLGNVEKLANQLHSKPYGRYKLLKQYYFQFGKITLYFTRIQGDPYATPSIVEIKVPFKHYKPEKPVEDLIYRRFYSALKKYSRRRGEGKSGILEIPKPSNAILRRSAIELRGNHLFLRCFVGLPSQRRRILGNAFLETVESLVKAVEETLRVEEERIKGVIALYKDQEYIRDYLVKNNYVAFIANGSILPRKCGNCEEPLENAIPFESPKELEVSLELPSGKTIEGALIKRGLITITGPAFYGKSTLLQAITQGVYNHIKRDGREFVISNPNAVYVFSEEGRVINNVDISAFVNLPDAKSFYTENASGATSLAAFIQESIELGAKVILIDEDTAATNLLYFDKELDKVFGERTTNTIQELAKSMVEKGINIVLVSGTNYRILRESDLTILAKRYKYFTLNLPREESEKKEYSFPRKRVIKKVNINKVKIKSRTLIINKSFELFVNSKTIREKGQLNTLAFSLFRLNKFEGKTIREFAEWVENVTKRGEWSKLGKVVSPSLSEVTRFDIVYIINRLPTKIIKFSFSN